MKFSIVTPAFNSERYIAETIESVISQKGNFEIEYIVADGGSGDRTVEIIKDYEERIKRGEGVKCEKIDFKWFSEKDRGMYDAINKGFDLATGDIYAWINSDDKYLPGAFDIIQKAFEKYSKINWLIGILKVIDEDSHEVHVAPCLLYEQSWIQKGFYNGVDAIIINQETVFWRAGLWERAGGINPGLKLAGDFYLWIKFAEFEKLYTLKRYVSCFRKHSMQLSHDMEAYQKECRLICDTEGKPSFKKKRALIKLFFKYFSKIHFFPYNWAYRLLFGKQDLQFIEVTDNGELVLKKGNFIIL